MDRTTETEHSRSSFGERLRRLRLAAGLSQEALAERAGLSAQAIGALETGKRRRPYPHTVSALADALGLSANERAALTEARASTAPSPAAAPPPLPRKPAPFVGRDDDVAAVLSRLRGGEDRLLTLTGPGGVGKTSLAIAAAEAARELFAGAVAFVPLAAITDAGLIASEAATALGLPAAGQRSPDDVVQAVLRSRRHLLVLDNLEHLPRAALWVAEILAGCPHVTVLATSRSPLRLKGEREILVAPLAVPQMHETPAPAEIQEAPAVRLFIERAPSPTFAWNHENAAAVTAICRRVDGLPLAIELAAARVKVFSPTELLARLDQMLPLLTGGPQDQASRLRSMSAAIAWSYDLLDPHEQAVFRRLAVFAGGFTLQAAEWVVGDGSWLLESRQAGPAPIARPPTPDPRPPTPSVLDLVTSLLDKSLIYRFDGGGGPRFGMLATIQAYGLEQLAAAGEEAATRRAHATHFCDLAEHAWPAFRRRTGQEMWLDRLEAERANLRAALTWLDGAGEAPSLLQLAGALSWFWYIRGPLAEGRSWLERAIAVQDADASGASLARAELGAGLLAHFQGAGQQARAWLGSCLARSPHLGDPWQEAFTLLLLGMSAEDHGDYDLAGARFSDALGRFQAAHDPSNVALALSHLGVTAWGKGDVHQATTLFEEAMAIQRAAHDGWGLSISLGYLGLLAGERGDFAYAAAAHKESLQLRWEAGVWEDVAASFADLAALAAFAGQPEQAARLFGAAKTVRAEIGRPPVPNFPERGVFERGEARARAALGPAAFARAEATGQALSREQAIAEATALADLLSGTGQAPSDTGCG